MILDLLFPKRCAGCRTYDVLLCDQCAFTHLDIAVVPHPSPYIDRVISIGPYSTPIWRRCVEQLKFHGVREMAICLSEWLCIALDAYEELDPHALLVPIPLHPRRERQRGYNQSALLVHAVAQRSNIAPAQLLRRTRYTQPLSRQKLHRRAQRISCAFMCEPAAPGTKQIILVDDVLTTGSTAAEAARTLRAWFSGSIVVLCVARGK